MSHPGHLHDKHVNIHAMFYLKWHFFGMSIEHGGGGGGGVEGKAYKIAAYM